MHISEENKGIKILSYIGELVLLNFLVILCSLPIVTAGAAFTAGYEILLTQDDPRDLILTTEYFHKFKSNFTKVTPIWLLLLLGLVIGFGDLIYAVIVSETVNIFFLIFAILILFLICTISMWLVALAAYYDNSRMKMLENALILAIGHLPKTLQIWATWLVPILFTLCFDSVMKYAGWIWILCGVSGLMAMTSTIIKPVFENRSVE